MSQCRFLQREVAAELYEGEPAGTIVKHLEARSTSSLQFEIIRGNTDNRFSINPSTGVVTTNWPLDYESIRLYNLSVTATNMVSTIIIETTQLFCIYFLFYVIPVVQSKIKVYVFNCLYIMWWKCSHYYINHSTLPLRCMEWLLAKQMDSGHPGPQDTATWTPDLSLFLIWGLLRKSDTKFWVSISFLNHSYQFYI